MENTLTNSNTTEKVTKHDFFFNTALYDKINLNNLTGNIDSFLDGRVDAYSARNNIDTTYVIKSHEMDDRYSYGFNGFHKVKLTCVRKPEDILYFFVAISKTHIFKVGQMPSLADLSFSEIEKRYSKHLERDDMKEFKKAIGLAAHGVGAGSFVYLRRIFEKLIQETYEAHKAEIIETEEVFKQQKMDKKVDTLKAHLPSELIKMKKVYSILSSGVHTLTEAQCLTLFPALKLSIELILEQKIEADARLKRNDTAQKQIAAIERALKAAG